MPASLHLLHSFTFGHQGDSFIWYIVHITSVFVISRRKETSSFTRGSYVQPTLREREITAIPYYYIAYITHCKELYKTKLWPILAIMLSPCLLLNTIK